MMFDPSWTSNHCGFVKDLLIITVLFLVGGYLYDVFNLKIRRKHLDEGVILYNSDVDVILKRKVIRDFKEGKL